MPTDDAIEAGIDPLVLAVARLRVQGKSWEECGQVVGRAADTLRHWQYKRAREWNAALTMAIDDMLATYENEALLVCRRNLRNPEDAAQAQAAARDILRHCRELRGTKMKLEHSGPAGGPLQVLLQLTDEELDAIAGADGDVEA